jgi:hypothetical protein
MRYPVVLLMSLFVLAASEAWSQTEDWELNKEKNGIRVYTGKRENSRLLAYRIVTTIKGSLQDVYEQVIDFHGNKKYLVTVEKIRVLQQKANTRVLVYMLFDLPWPFRDRDFVNRMTMEVGRDTIFLKSSPASGKVDVKEGVVRIKEFSEKWRLVRESENTTSLRLQGYADPGGKLPSWVVNMFMVKEPYELVHGIKTQVEGKDEDLMYEPPQQNYESNMQVLQ